MKKVELYKCSQNKVPDYYSPILDSPANRYAIIYRSILISSDRISSQLSHENVKRAIEDDEFCNSLIETSKKTFDFIPPIHYDKKRVDLQIDIAKKCNENGTFIVKAPAGFGKTLVGLAWSLPRVNKLLWVCPRNVIVESVYDSILCEIENMGLSGKVSVELFVTGERKKYTNFEKPVFKSDIVVTNIDNFLSPIAKNKFGIWGYEILKRDVVFDEFHEFITENALFSGFVEIMKIRHQIISCSTVLLSATPSDFNFLWDNPMKKTHILPNENEHYPAAHQKKYTLKFIKEDEVVKQNNSFIITNSIHNAQLKKKELGVDLLIHSDFLEEDKRENMKTLFEHYKKNSKLKEKPSVVSSPIMQASMDISSLFLYQSPLSPEADIQRVGRCCRFGEYDNPMVLFFRIEKEKRSESKAIETLYSLQLNKI
jgi:CRISPR/Cas system-associated endonuclease/helicase Cas3